MLLKKRTLIYGLSILIMLQNTGCGFHLRGFGMSQLNLNNNINNINNNIKNIYVDVVFDDVSEYLTEALNHKFSFDLINTNNVNNNINNNINLNNKRFLMRTKHETYNEVIEVLSGKGQLREIKLQKKIAFSLEDLQTKTILIPLETYETSRDFSVNESLILSKNSEKKRLIKDMQNQIANDLMQRAYYSIQNHLQLTNNLAINNKIIK